MSSAGSSLLQWVSAPENIGLAVGAVLIAGSLYIGTSKWASRRARRSYSNCALNPEEYTKCRLSKVTPVSHNSAVYRFQLPRNAQLNLPIGRHVSIRATVGTRQAMRSYTPISDPETRGFFELLVKTYPNGTISKYLAELNVGDFVDFKGPKGSFEYQPHLYHHLGMIAGGTGITPIYQVIKHSLSQPKDKTKFSLIYANVNEEDILLRTELDSLAKEHSERFKIFYTLDNPPNSWKQGKGFVTSDMIKDHLPSPSKGIRILVCGPPPMVASMQSHCNALGYEESMFYRF